MSQNHAKTVFIILNINVIFCLFCLAKKTYVHAQEPQIFRCEHEHEGTRADNKML